MDFSVTTMFVALTGTLQASGGTEVTPVGTIGLFRPDYTLATAGNIAAAKYFYITSGRPATGQLGAGNIRSDKIAAANVIDWYKTVFEDTASLQITTLGNFDVECGEDVVVTFSVHGHFVDALYYNGLFESAMVTAPCCNCGEVPCAQINATDIEALVDKLIAQLQANPRLSAYLTFSKSGSGATSAIVTAAKVPQTLTTPGDISANQPYFDRIWFRAFAYTGTPALVDYFVDDVCEGVTAVATVTQRSTYKHGTSAEIRNMEEYYYNYNQSAFKNMFKKPGWNGNFISNTLDGYFYDLYYIKCKQLDQQSTWASYVAEDFTVIVAFQAGQGAAFETVLTAALGAPKNYSGLDISTTTTTSTSSTTTTTTSTLTP